MKHDPTIAPLGARAEDSITGYEGIVVSVAYHITGCERIGVRALNEPSEVDATEWLYEANALTGDEPIEGYVADEPVTSTDFDLGWRLRDRVTGAEGVATTINFNLYNCPRVGIDAVDDEPPEEPRDRFWFDAPRMEVVDRPSDAGLVESLSDFLESVQQGSASSTGAPATDSQRKTNDGAR